MQCGRWPRPPGAFGQILPPNNEETWEFGGKLPPKAAVLRNFGGRFREAAPVLRPLAWSWPNPAAKYWGNLEIWRQPAAKSSGFAKFWRQMRQVEVPGGQRLPINVVLWALATPSGPGPAGPWLGSNPWTGLVVECGPGAASAFRSMLYCGPWPRPPGGQRLPIYV